MRNNRQHSDTKIARQENFRRAIFVLLELVIIPYPALRTHI